MQTSETVDEIPRNDPRVLTKAILTATSPVVVRGLVASWPVVKAGLASAQAASRYLCEFYRDATVGVWRGLPEIDGRFFYNEDFTGFNYQPEMQKLDQVLDELARHLNDERPPALYVGSTTVDTCLPGFRAENDFDLGERQALMSVWIGNRTRVAAHQDLPDNLACVAVGHRRFTIFPPEELDNLYIGPLDFTPAGQAISLVDFAKPDLERYPKFADALSRAKVAELGPGDAIFIPSMWWHHVEALDPFNVLINYWWRQSPGYMDSPMNALMLAMMTVRDLPDEQRKAWQIAFRHYVFAADGDTAQHIPAHARYSLSPLSENAARAMRAQLLKKLNR